MKKAVIDGTVRRGDAQCHEADGGVKVLALDPHGLFRDQYGILMKLIRLPEKVKPEERIFEGGKKEAFRWWDALDRKHVFWSRSGGVGEVKRDFARDLDEKKLTVRWIDFDDYRLDESFLLGLDMNGVGGRRERILRAAELLIPRGIEGRLEFSSLYKWRRIQIAWPRRMYPEGRDWPPDWIELPRH